MYIPHPVIEKLHKNEFELGNLIDEAKHFIKEKYLVFSENEFEQTWIVDNIEQNRLSKVKDTLKKINDKFIEIDNNWKKTSEKDDQLVKHEDVITLRGVKFN